MSAGQSLLFGLYLLCTAGLAAYGAHGLCMLWLFLRRAARTRRDQRRVEARARRRPGEVDWPPVTTQLPMYNEAAVCERLIRAAARMRYPGEHEIQVLDDSTDASREVVDEVVADLRADGVDIEVLRRPSRDGYKAGALAHGLERASGSRIAIFDADFVPPEDFLLRTVPHLEADEEVACVQARWDHLNREDSWLTRAQSVGIDGHFAVEQGARAWNGLYMNFNGTAGVWRREAIADAGGWEGDTITEDLDLSYRVQLAGYRMVYALDVACPAEIPPGVDGLKSQQRRWARGSMQTARKLLGRVWRADGSLGRKVAATFHLTHYLVSVLMVCVALLTLPVLYWVPFPDIGHWLWLAWGVIIASAASPCIGYWAAGWTLGRSRFALRNIPGLVVLGSGLCLNNGLAALAGLFGGEVPFVRTPKSGSRDEEPAEPGEVGETESRYLPPKSKHWWAEIGLGLYCLAALGVYASVEKWLIGLFLGFYATGFLALGWASRPRLRKRRGEAGEGEPEEEEGGEGEPEEVGGEGEPEEERLVRAASDAT